ncbi:tyrosine-type recombinase/integrase [Phaeovulum sp. NW3]|uniref:tyrosine-type recombinase/integrase n=1 Tax=Phaeovulum sp. NW3 TaxID=2934933 RepID=UPI00202200A2|nr:tyrosine-type recombinase/integrase [Phaeovulum sp. NW3]
MDNPPPKRPAATNTLRAYAQDWAHFTRWCRMRGADPLPPSGALIALYVADLAAPQGKAPTLSVTSIERRLSGLAWGYAKRGLRLDRAHRDIAARLADLRREQRRAPARKQAIRPEDIHAMIATLPHDLRGLRDRAILLIGFAGGLRRSEIVGLDLGRDDTVAQRGWVEIGNDGIRIALRDRTGWREVAIPRSPTEQTCPVHALGQWMHYGRIGPGPLFVAVSRDGRRATGRRLSDKHIARLVKRTVADAGLRPDLPRADRVRAYSGQSLRAGATRGDHPARISDN